MFERYTYYPGDDNLMGIPAPPEALKQAAVGSDETCQARTVDIVTHIPFFCTQRAGHSGDHFAYTLKEGNAVYRWPRDEDLISEGLT